MIKYKTGDIFTERVDAICIPTNGYITKYGNGVMGKGVAKQAANYWPGIKKLLGERLQEIGHIVMPLTREDRDGRVFIDFEHKEVEVPYHVLSLPTKPDKIILEDFNQLVSNTRNLYRIGSEVPGFHVKSSLDMVMSSLGQLYSISWNRGWNSVALPYAGCGEGEIDKKELCSLVEELPDVKCDFIFVEKS